MSAIMRKISSEIVCLIYNFNYFQQWHAIDIYDYSDGRHNHINDRYNHGADKYQHGSDNQEYGNGMYIVSIQKLLTG